MSVPPPPDETSGQSGQPEASVPPTDLPPASDPAEQVSPPATAPQGYPTGDAGYAQPAAPPPGYPPAGTYPPAAGYPQTAAGYAKPDNYLVWAILTTILCCLPLGIVSLVYSTQVDSKWNLGDYAGAEASSQSARTWAIWSAVVGVAFTVLVILLVFVLPLLGFLPLLFMSDTSTTST